MGRPAAIDFDHVKTLLKRSAVVFTEEPDGRLEIGGGPEEYLIELDAERGVSCLFGVDMEELRLLVSGSGNEDLGEDELQRVAREHLRPLRRRYEALFTRAGFVEEVRVDAHSYAVAFVKAVAGMPPETVVEWVRWARRPGRAAG
ncbi:MAG: hypothetical protein AB1515_00795 [Nitrospirota bacterium]